MQLLPATYTTWAAITPSDSTILNCRAIYVGGNGNLALSKSGNSTADPVVTITGVVVGNIYPLALDGGRVMAATTATNLVALS